MWRTAEGHLTKQHTLGARPGLPLRFLYCWDHRFTCWKWMNEIDWCMSGVTNVLVTRRGEPMTLVSRDWWSQTPPDGRPRRHWRDYISSTLSTSSNIFQVELLDIPTAQTLVSHHLWLGAIFVQLWPHQIVLVLLLRYLHHVIQLLPVCHLYSYFKARTNPLLCWESDSVRQHVGSHWMSFKILAGWPKEKAKQLGPLS